MATFIRNLVLGSPVATFKSEADKTNHHLIQKLIIGFFIPLFFACAQSFESEVNPLAQNSVEGDVIVKVSYWEDNCESCHKTEKIGNEARFKYWSTRSESSLADYISATMPYSNPGVCVGPCATQTARFMQAVVNGRTIIDSDSATSDSDDSDNPKQDDSQSGSGIAIPSNYAQSCASCHKPENIASEFAGWKLQNTESLISYIEMTMPFANADACVGDCANETATYIMDVLDAASAPSNDNPPSSGSDNSAPPADTPSQTKPIKPSALQLSQENDAIVLSWTDNSDNEQSFTVWRRLGSGSWVAYQSLPENTVTFTDSSLAEALIRYRISATNSAGTSDLSNTVSVDLTPLEEPMSCTAPQYVAGTAYSSGQLVQNRDRYFECNIAGWCSSNSAFYYAPGTGIAWTDAWSETECSGGDQNSVVLDAPTLLSATVTERSVAISWLDNATGETAYTILKAVDDSPYTTIATLPADTETYVDSDNTPGTSVRYKVFAKNGTDEGAELTTSQLTIAKAEFNALAYYASDCASCHGARGEGTSNGALQIEGFQNATLTLAELADSIERTMPFGKADECVGECAQAVAEYVFDNFVVQSNVPNAVSNIFVGANNENTLINISWSDNSDNETGFRIERKVNSGNFTTWKTVAANITSTTDNAVSIGSTYQYRITAFNTTDVSQRALSSDIRLEQKVTLPLKPSDVSVAIQNGRGVLSWKDNATNETNYVVQVRKNKGNWSADIVVPANSTSYTDTNVDYGSIYDYRVLATNSAGDSAWSSEVTLDLSAGENQEAFDVHCFACHRPGGIAVDLKDGFTERNWQDKDFESFVAKVNTMPAASCDTECKEKAAVYVWSESWGYELTEEVATNGRGVRGVRLLTSYEYFNTVKDVFGFTVPEERLPADRNASTFKYASEAHAGVVVYDRLNEFMLLAEYVAEKASRSSYGCNSSCSNAQLQTLLEKAFRRNIDSSLLNEYVSFQNQHGRVDTIASILLSPWFLYRSEVGEWDVTAQAYQLSDYEVATALSYQLWGTAPDSTLLQKARTGQLSTAAQIEAQANAMVADSRAAEHLVEFVKYYTNTQANLAEKPNLSLSMIQAMETERALSITHALTQGTATLDELYNPGYSYVNNSLAGHYGMSGISGSSFRKTNTDNTRGGLLHQGILQVHNSDFAATSLVRRGKMIRENLMCHDLGVPSGVDPSSIQLPSTPISTRERWDVITGPSASDGQCWACHQLMNEPGSVLERYDSAGQYRLTEKAYNNNQVTLTLDTAGVLRSNDTTEVLLTYNDARDLSEYLSSSPVGRDCFVDNYVRFTTGYEVDNQFKADVDQWSNRFRQTGEIWPLVLDSVLSDSFLYRTERD